MANSRTKTIQELNDRFRKGDKSIPGTVVITSGVQMLMAESQERGDGLSTILHSFDEFNRKNDPYGAHDFGKFRFLNAELYWKIDLYNESYDGESEDIADLNKTCRVLTVMLTDEC